VRLGVAPDLVVLRVRCSCKLAMVPQQQAAQHWFKQVQLLVVLVAA
jgi:hypothetical protein